MANIEEIPSLNKISNKLYEIINNQDIESNQNNVLKDMITKYYENINNNKKILQEKELYYNININNPRIIQDELYTTYVNERQELYDSWLINKNIESLRKLSTLNKFDYKIIPDIYTYNININKNFGKKFKQQNNDDIDEIEEDIKDEHEDDIKKEDDIKEEEDIKEEDDNLKKDKKEDHIPVINNCTEKKEKECKKKGKICNPKSGRCIIPPKVPDKQKDRPDDKQDDKSGDKLDQDIDKDDDKKKKIIYPK
jgi:hypothetical protein